MPVILAFSGWKGKLIMGQAGSLSYVAVNLGALVWPGLSRTGRRARSGWHLGSIPVIMAKANEKSINWTGRINKIGLLTKYLFAVIFTILLC
jgi:hypothetical protein